MCQKNIKLIKIKGKNLFAYLLAIFFIGVMVGQVWRILQVGF